MARPTGKQLTAHLRRLAQEAETIDDDGAVVTKGEALARLLFKKALGSVERKVIDGQTVEEVSKPEAWAIQLVWDRLEGKTPVATPDEIDRVTAADKVSEMAKMRANQLATAVLTGRSKPPSLKDRNDANPET